MQLAKQLGVTFQQVQKYERGANRIGSGRLYEAARILEVPVSAFFEDLPETAGSDAIEVPTLPVEVTRLALRLASVESDETRRAAIERCDNVLNELDA